MAEGAVASSSVASRMRDLGLNQFAGVLDSLGAGAVLDDKDVTIFAPSDQAVDDFLSVSSLEGEGASAIVGNHFVGGPAKNSSQFVHSLVLDTLVKNFSSCGHDTLTVVVDGHELRLQAGGSSAAIVSPDNSAGSAMIHVVDAVLVPCKPRCERNGAAGQYEELISPMSSLNQTLLLGSLDKIPLDEEITLVQPSGALLVKFLEGGIHAQMASDIGLLTGMLAMNHVSIGPADLSVGGTDSKDSFGSSAEIMECRVESVTASVGESVAVAHQDDFKQRNALTVIGGGGNSSASFTGKNGCTSTVYAWDISVVFSPPTFIEMLESSVQEDEGKECTGFLKFLSTNPQYSIVASMVQSLIAVDAMDIMDSGTFFVPDNTAMGSALFEHNIQLENLTDTSQLKIILDYHKASKDMHPTDFANGAEIETSLKVKDLSIVKVILDYVLHSPV